MRHIKKGITSVFFIQAMLVAALSADVYAAYGPGVVLDGPIGSASYETGDNYLHYQWGFYNFGQISFGESQMKEEAKVYGNLNDYKDGYLSIPRAPEPSDFETKIYKAKPGVDINIEPAWDLYEKGENKREVVVAVIDTGIEIENPELKDSIWINPGEIPGDGIDNDQNGYVDDVNGWNFVGNNNQVYTGLEDYHGTHAAGTIAAKKGNGGIAGIADGTYVKLMPLKVLGRNGYGKDEYVLDAIRYAEKNGADICNLSLGSGSYTKELAETIQNSQMLFVVASGNGDENGEGYSTDEKGVYPAALPFDNIISVANLMLDGTLAPSSNYGKTSVDLAAPGSYILSTIPKGRFAYLSGTSMAAPEVTGVAAMVYSYRTDLTRMQVKEVILKSVTKLDALKDLCVSGGMLNAYQAMVEPLSEEKVG